MLGALVGVACIAGTMVLGLDFNSFLKDAHNQMNNTANAASQVVSEQAAKQLANNTTSQEIQLGSGETKFCFEGGSICVNVPAGENGTLPDTTGSNGSDLTEYLANVLNAAAKQARNDPSVSPDLKKVLTKLANQAHQLAGSENIAESQHQKYCVQGQLECTNLDHSNVAECSTFSAYNNVQDERSALNRIYNELNQIMSKNSSVLSPTLKTQVDSAMHAMNTVADAYRVETTASGGSSVSPPLTGGASDTQTNANTICESGGDEEKCLKEGFLSEDT